MPAYQVIFDPERNTYRQSRPQRIKWIEWICETCDTLVRKPRNKVGIMHKRRFCSAECANKGLRGSGNPAWRGGYNPDYGSNWTEQRQLARDRDQNICAKCGLDGSKIGKHLDIHHIVRFADFTSATEANAVENLITYCHSCHMVVEWREKRSQS
jgi:5-methylcytosine-specific restriction endonuclease McrA